MSDVRKRQAPGGLRGGVAGAWPTSDATFGLISERQWQHTVVALFRLHGWRVWHDTTAWRSEPGWPDLVCVHPAHGIRFLELKRETGRLSPAQESWHASLLAAGQVVAVLRPSDWPRAIRLVDGLSLEESSC